MLKKTIALTLIFALLAPASSALAAACEETDQAETAAPTIEEIFNEYHMKSFQEQSTGISLCSAGKSLEEETVEALNNAGYEAFYITDSNYHDTEDLLRIDFDEIGLSESYSYIIVPQAGGDTDISTTASDTLLPPHTIIDDSNLSGSTYYNGNWYHLRYFTITSADNPDFQVGESYTKSNSYLADTLGDLLSSTLSIVADAATDSPLGTIASLFAIPIDNALPDNNYTSTTSGQFVFYATTIWTRRYIMVWDDSIEAWRTTQYSVYAESLMQAVCSIYDADTNSLSPYTYAETSYTYSRYYNDRSQCEIDAIVSCISGTKWCDRTGNIKYTFSAITGKSTVLFTHKEPTGFH